MVGIFYVLGGLGVTSAGPNGVGLLGLGLGLGLGSLGIITFCLYCPHYGLSVFHLNLRRNPDQKWLGFFISRINQIERLKQHPFSSSFNQDIIFIRDIFLYSNQLFIDEFLKE